MQQIKISSEVYRYLAFSLEWIDNFRHIFSNLRTTFLFSMTTKWNTFDTFRWNLVNLDWRSLMYTRFFLAFVFHLFFFLYRSCESCVYQLWKNNKSVLVIIHFEHWQLNVNFQRHANVNSLVTAKVPAFGELALRRYCTDIARVLHGDTTGSDNPRIIIGSNVWHADTATSKGTSYFVLGTLVSLTILSMFLMYEHTFGHSYIYY